MVPGKSSKVILRGCILFGGDNKEKCMPRYLHVDPGAFNIEACSQSLRFEEKNKKISLLVQEFDIYGTHHQMNGENAPPPPPTINQ